MSLDDNLHWYKDAIIYELHIKAFRDANGDGIGDFAGLMEKLDYLQELGVSAIWVLPFYPSPLRDDGYDIADYYAINPSYGTVEEFRQFLGEAHRRNLKVITELVINHTSDQHPWFQRARHAPKGSPERDFYVWTDNPEQYKDVRIIFQDFEGSNWSWDPVANQYYWHRFFHHQPDLNYDNPLVQEEIFKILDFWCAMGVDGFRLDAVPYLYEREGTNGENLPETHAFLKKLRAHIDQKFPGTVFLAEANMWPEDSASYFGNGDECHMNYHFPVMPRMFMALQREDRYPITDIFDQTPAIPETCQWAMFLRNHDELTLEMVTDEERDYMYKVYAKDPKARINLGIRHRLAPLLENNRRKIELMNSLLFSLPGTPVLYYGDEIGMGDNFYLGDRDGVRTPMQWSPDRNAGFSNTNPQRLYLPVILDPEYHYESVNVEMQRANTSSLFWFMKRIIGLRKRYKAFGRGDLRFLPIDNPKVLAYTRTWEEETILVVVNLSKYPQPAEVPLEGFAGHVPVEIFSRNRFPAVREGQPYFFTLGPHAFQWFLLQPGGTGGTVATDLPALRADAWEALFTDSRTTETLEASVLPAYLGRVSWFESGGRPVYTLRITNRAAMPLDEGDTAMILLCEVQYENGLPDSYHIPVAFVSGTAADRLRDRCPQSVLARLTLNGEEGFLCDAVYLHSFHNALFRQLSESGRLQGSNGHILFASEETLKDRLGASEAHSSLVAPGERGYTAIQYNNGFFLKVFRKVDPTVQPDVELTRYLTKTAFFPNVPRYLGTIEWQFPKDNITLGLVQELVENHGDGHTYLLERINNFIERILARDRNTLQPEVLYGSMALPASFDDLPESVRVLLGGNAPEQVHLLGVRMAELHATLLTAPGKEFQPEAFSLHYQRSLYSSMSSLVREVFSRPVAEGTLSPSTVAGLRTLRERRGPLLDKLKQIYEKKFDIYKVRIHGHLGLEHVLFTGRDIMISDFGGDGTLSYSERRLRRSPLRDVTSMIRSIHSVAYEGFASSTQFPPDELQAVLPFARMWAHHLSGIFLAAWLQGVQGLGLVPDSRDDLQVLLHTFLLEGALRDLQRELAQPSDRVSVPVSLIQDLMGEAVPT